MSQATPECATVSELFFAVWPFTPDPDCSYTGHPLPQTVFSLRHFSEVVEHLNKHDLLFRVKLDLDVSNPWKRINRSLHEHLTDNDYKLPLRLEDDGKEFSSLSWDVLVQVGKKKDAMIMNTGTAGRAQFMVQFLLQKAIKVQIEYNGINRICECLLLAPTNGNLRGPIPQGPQRFWEHVCLPWCLMARYKWLKLKSNEDGDECIADECPSCESGSSASRTRVVHRPKHCNMIPLQRSQSPSREEIDTEHRDVSFSKFLFAPILDSDGNSDLETMEPPKKDQPAVKDMAMEDVINVDMMDFHVDEDLDDEVESPVLENLT
ncbi:hypothetical protein AX14_012620 [Amanita brunnescens Koide BX004]|nr:hypothetical protein AX14_012620 [Amanita brunnescens Koide BX004]